MGTSQVKYVLKCLPIIYMHGIYDEMEYWGMTSLIMGSWASSIGELK
jgi:hypothetical protein